jgi:dolichol-phosphate mannosyltransferase
LARIQTQGYTLQAKAATTWQQCLDAHEEESCITSTVEHLHVELRLQNVPHEIVVVDDDSADATWTMLESLKARVPTLRPVQNCGPHGFGRAIACGLDHMNGDAVVVMMADESDSCRDVVRYWNKLNEGYDCVFGSRFMRAGGVIDYPKSSCFSIASRTRFSECSFALN